MIKSKKFKAPATSANLGPGFDCLGLALPFYDELEVFWSDNLSDKFDYDQLVELQGRYIDVPNDNRNLLYKLIDNELIQNGFGAVKFHLRCVNSIPHARGLGSSSAAIILSLKAADAILNDLTKGTQRVNIFSRALEIEGHGDNVAPCFYGGCQLVTLNSEVVQIPVHKNLKALVQVNSEPCSTKDAREALPKQIFRSLAVKNTASVATLIMALINGDNELLFQGTEDFVHQDFRKNVYPESLNRVKKLRELGIATAISGAGSTIISLKFGNFGDLSKIVHHENNEKWEVLHFGL
ncbi:MAG: homoserine kinase [Candidatus Ancillula sp.]|jgi:homoserine kinase|nr:homoserine kinase [Candidatus Ancillula sp.]